MYRKVVGFVKNRTDVVFMVLAAVAVLVMLFFMMGHSSEGFTASEKKMVVLFYAPWCPHCKDLMPTWNKLAQKHSGNSAVELKKVNCDEHPEEAQKHKVEGYPTIIMFRNGREVAKFDATQNKRDEEGIEKFISEN